MILPKIILLKVLKAGFTLEKKTSPKELMIFGLSVSLACLILVLVIAYRQLPYLKGRVKYRGAIARFSLTISVKEKVCVCLCLPR
jgi:hypothetical protein